MFIMAKIVDWDRRKTEEAMEDDSLKGYAKCFGVGCIEGAVDACALVGAAVTIISIISFANAVATSIKK